MGTRVLQRRSRNLAVNFGTFRIPEECILHEFEDPNFESFIKEHIMSMQNEWHQPPKVAIIVANSSSFKDCPPDIWMLNTIKVACHEIRKYLPHDCVLIVINSAAILQQACRPTPRSITIEALFFSSVRLNSVQLLTWTLMDDPCDRTRLLGELKKSFFSRKDLKMLVFFYDMCNSYIIKWVRAKLLPALQKEFRADDKVVIAGCALHDHAGIFHSRSSECVQVGLVGNKLQGARLDVTKYTSEGGQFLVAAFFGKSVFSASMIFEGRFVAKRQFSQKLNLFRESCESKSLVQENSFGMIFTNIKRIDLVGEYHQYERENGYKAIAIRNQFPQLPILTVHSYGTIGRDVNLLESDGNDFLKFRRGFSMFSVLQFQD